MRNEINAQRQRKQLMKSLQWAVTPSGESLVVNPTAYVNYSRALHLSHNASIIQNRTALTLNPSSKTNLNPNVQTLRVEN